MILPGWAPAALALVGVLGPFLLARKTIRRPLARALVLAALIGLAVAAGLLAIDGRTMRAADCILGGALVALAAVGIRRPHALATLAVAAIAAARALSLGIAGELASAALWALVVLFAAGIAGARFMRASSRRAARR